MSLYIEIPPWQPRRPVVVTWARWWSLARSWTGTANTFFTRADLMNNLPRPQLLKTWDRKGGNHTQHLAIKEVHWAWMAYLDRPLPKYQPIKQHFCRTIWHNYFCSRWLNTPHRTWQEVENVSINKRPQSPCLIDIQCSPLKIFAGCRDRRMTSRATF